jgi:hypothetical protein
VKRGVIVGCDNKQEWMLPWWWSHYEKHHDLPVAFIDFGMSKKFQKWCKARGSLIPLMAPKDFVSPPASISSELCEKWEMRYGSHLWKGRSQWFYKPFALLQSPFKETIWFDLDCEILGSLTHLFQKLHRHLQVAVARDNTGSFEEVGYNSGVIIFNAKSPLLSRWASACISQNHQFLGDQEVLTHLIQEDGIEIVELDEKYNWVVKNGVHPEAVVLHWSGAWGKGIISNISKRPYLNELWRDFK